MNGCGRSIGACQQGFTLVELSIVVAVIGILAAIAFPSYVEHTRKAKRAEAKAILLEAAQALERNYTLQGTYLNSDGDALADVIPSQSPVSGTANYTLAAVGTPTATTYVLRATRTNSMTDDLCGNFQINQAGSRTLNGNTRTVDECW